VARSTTTAATGCEDFLPQAAAAAVTATTTAATGCEDFGEPVGTQCDSSGDNLDKVSKTKIIVYQKEKKKNK